MVIKQGLMSRDFPGVVNACLSNRLSHVLSDHARYLTKLQMRQPTIDKLLSQRQEDIDHFVGFITKDSIQASLGMYLAALKKKSQASKK